ncbi:MAG: class I SAM-dependent methyltransferase [Gammaproteobacteria bacterium]|nr:class I SAM-dependent methyltransferase [Gammaproteobacteria bacterium]
MYNFLRLLIAPTYREDGLATVHNCDFLKDKRFLKAYHTALHLHPGMDIRWRVHVTQWAGWHASRLDGDFVECGVNRAFLSSSVMNFIDFDEIADRKFYLFDTYCGLVENQISPADKAAYRNYYEDTYQLVSSSFNNNSNIIVIRGVVPDSLATVYIEKVAYLSIDMNCALPELAALEFFWPKIVIGGVIILDDYGFSGHEEQKRVADCFSEKQGVKVLSLPTGQGLLIKS